MNQMRYKTEDRIQQECYLWFWNTYPDYRGMLFHIPNGGARSSREGFVFKQIGVYPGVADLQLLYKGKSYFFELKNEKGKMSDKQLEWEKRVKLEGFHYSIIRSLEEFQKTIKIIFNDI